MIINNISLINADLERRNCASDRRASAANVIDSNTDIFNGLSVLFNVIN
jgi:hypothetical protein